MTELIVLFFGWFSCLEQSESEFMCAWIVCAAYSSMLPSMLGRVVVSALRGVELPLRSLFRASQTTMSPFPFPPSSSLILRRLQSTASAAGGDGGAGRQVDAPSSPSPTATTPESNHIQFGDVAAVKLPWYVSVCHCRIHYLLRSRTDSHCVRDR
jgi:hypothetical protein